jgi:hypothetical protein
VRSSGGCVTDGCGRTSAPSRPSTMPSRPSTRPSDAGGRRSSAFVREHCRGAIPRRLSITLSNLYDVAPTIIGVGPNATISITPETKTSPTDRTFDVLKNFVANMILEQVEGKPGKINYERIISGIVNHIMTFCIGLSG